jgi:hypothetical protein
VSLLLLAAVLCLKTTNGDWLLTETYIAGAIACTNTLPLGTQAEIDLSGRAFPQIKAHTKNEQS